MIEKLKEHDVVDPKTDKVIGKIGCDLREIMDKLNEAVDAVNELQKQYDNVCIWVGEQKLKTPAENVRDKFAEQRKWIGKLCWFSNGDDFDEVGYLTEIDPDMPEAKFCCDCHDYYEECKPVKPDDDIIYKGDNNE